MSQLFDVEAIDELEDSFEEELWDQFAEAEDLDAWDTAEDGMADALEAEDTDEFFRRIAEWWRRRSERGRASQAPMLPPSSSQKPRGDRLPREPILPPPPTEKPSGVYAIPIPRPPRLPKGLPPVPAQSPSSRPGILTRTANFITRLFRRNRSDRGDELDALDEILDFAESENVVDMLSPTIASLIVHNVMPESSRLPLSTRRQLVRSVGKATSTLARRQGPQAVRAIPNIVESVRRTARRHRLPVRALPQAIRRSTTRIAAYPRLVQRLARLTFDGPRPVDCSAYISTKSNSPYHWRYCQGSPCIDERGRRSICIRPGAGKCICKRSNGEEPPPLGRSRAVGRRWG
jgi:hypothetical protein